MIIASVNSPIQSFPEVQAAADVAAKNVNAAGGIRGHKVEILFCNSASDPNKAQDCARTAVQDKVDAVIGQIDIFTNLNVPILQAAGIPDIGLSSNGNPIDFTNPDVYPLQAGTFGGYLAEAAGLKELGKTRIAVATADVPSAIVNAKGIEAASKIVGVKFEGYVTIPDTGVTDYSPYAEKLAKLNPQGIVNILSPAPDLGILKAAQSIGLNVQWLNQAQAFGEQEAAQANGLGNGMLITSPFPSVRSTQYPLIQAFDSQMEAAGISPQNTSATTYPHWMLGINSWLTVWGIDKLAQTFTGDITPASLKTALGTATNLQLPGGFVWSPATPGPKGYDRVSNWTQYFLTIKNGQLVTTNLKPYSSAPVAAAL
ncbi:MAG TPA: ABC transporter substrate-binding protein [Solirubrobacteraceae bacterium]|nr:ABC transporter substrate-binding protein [Solirubrobacteraceae bacterium]